MDCALGDPSILVRSLLAGLLGPIEISGQKFNNMMPLHTDLKDSEIADVLTYVRKSWSNDASSVSEDSVKQTRAKHADRKSPWTAGEFK